MQKRKPPTKDSLLKSSVVITGIVFISLLLIFDLSLGGGLRFYTTWAICGQRPLQGKIGKSMHKHYEPASFGNSDFLMSNKYFCTVSEAESAGYLPS